VTSTAIRKLDQNGLKTAQGLTIVLLLLTFILGTNAWPLVAFVAIAQLLGGLGLPFAPYKLIYQAVFRRFVKPNIIADNPEPHQFSMLLGAFFNSLATVALLLNRPLLAWILVLDCDCAGEPEFLAEFLRWLLDVLSVKPIGRAFLHSRTAQGAVNHA